MTKKDYISVAQGIRRIVDTATEPAALALMREVADAQAQHFHANNPRFRREQFMEACGLPEQQP